MYTEYLEARPGKASTGNLVSQTLYFCLSSYYIYSIILNNITMKKTISFAKDNAEFLTACAFGAALFATVVINTLVHGIYSGF
jgi:uncharacterized membrane protein YqgA involved in biofilm formation